MRMCRLEEVECEFSGVGCDGQFRREDQEEHIRQNNQKHLTMTATTSVKMNQKLQQKLLEQEEKLQEQEEKLQEQEEKQQELEEKQQEQEEKLQEQEEKLQEQEEKLQEQEEKLQEQEGKLQEQEEKLQEQEEKLQEQEEKLQEQGEQIQKVRELLQEHGKKFERVEEKSDQNEGAVGKVTNFINLKRRFAMENFSLEKVKDKVGDWNGPAMYTHMCGYKFCIVIDANGHGLIRGKAMHVFLYAMQGEYDQQLKWPARVSFTLELLHQHGGQNIIHTLTKAQWQKPTRPYTLINSFPRIQYGPRRWAFLEHSKLADFLYNDTLYFHLSNITVY